LLFIQKTDAFGINDRANETLGINVELEIPSQAADFFNEIVSFFAYGGICIVKTLNQTPFHMQRIWGGFPLDFGPSVAFTMMTRTSRKATALSDSFHGELDGRP
jgi:hypothetical protein